MCLIVNIFVGHSTNMSDSGHDIAKKLLGGYIALLKRPLSIPYSQQTLQRSMPSLSCLLRPLDPVLYRDSRQLSKIRAQKN